MLCIYTAVMVVSCVPMCQTQSNGVEAAIKQLTEQSEACGDSDIPSVL